MQAESHPARQNLRGPMHPELEAIDKKIDTLKLGLSALKKSKRRIDKALRRKQSSTSTSKIVGEIAATEIALKRLRTTKARLLARIEARGDVLERVDVETPTVDQYGIEVGTETTSVIRRKPVALRSLCRSQEMAVDRYRDLIDRVAGSSAMRALEPMPGRGSGGVSDGGATGRLADAERLRAARDALDIGEIALQGRARGAALRSIDLFDSIVLRSIPIDEILRGRHWPQGEANREACRVAFAWLVARCACTLGMERGTDSAMPGAIVRDARGNAPAPAPAPAPVAVAPAPVPDPAPAPVPIIRPILSLPD